MLGSECLRCPEEIAEGLSSIAADGSIAQHDSLKTILKITGL